MTLTAEHEPHRQADGCLSEVDTLKPCGCDAWHGCGSCEGRYTTWRRDLGWLGPDGKPVDP